MPIVNLLDSYKVYHKVDPPPPHLWKSLVKLASLVMFFARERFMRSHTPPVCPSCIHPPLLSPLSLSLSICSGTTSSNVDFPPFFRFFPGNYIFGILIFSVSCLRLFVHKRRPQILLRKSWKEPILPPCHLKKEKLFSPIHLGSDGSSFGCSLLSVCESVCCLFIPETFHHVIMKAKKNQKTKKLREATGVSCSSNVLLLLLLLFVLLILDWNAVVVWCSGSPVC